MLLLIVGGSDAGNQRGAARSRDRPGVEVTVVLDDNYPNFSICGLPFFVSGETSDWRRLAHHTEFAGVELLVVRPSHVMSIPASPTKNRSGQKEPAV